MSVTPNPLVNAVLALDCMSTDYRVAMTPAAALAFAQSAQGYNNLEAEQLAQLVERINAHIPPMAFPDTAPGVPNRNNGLTHHTIYVGNENTRVLYLRVVKSYMPASYDYDKLALQLAVWGAGADAAECDVQTDNEHAFEYRFWWD